MALERAPSKQMTLAEIYDWIVANIPFFKDKGDHNSSIGWKNSIRHNLSLHDKFSRVTPTNTTKVCNRMLQSINGPGPTGPSTGPSVVSDPVGSADRTRIKTELRSEDWTSAENETKNSRLEFSVRFSGLVQSSNQNSVLVLAQSADRTGPLDPRTDQFW